MLAEIVSIIKFLFNNSFFILPWDLFDIFFFFSGKTKTLIRNRIQKNINKKGIIFEPYLSTINPIKITANKKDNDPLTLSFP